MADFTGSISKLLVAWPDDVDDFVFADVLTDKNGLDTIVFPVSYYLTDSIALDLGDTKTVTWPTTGTTQTAMTKWIKAKVIGSAKITATGTDPNGGGATTTEMETTGIEKYPGIILMYVTGLSDSFTVTGDADSTTVQIMAAII